MYDDLFNERIKYFPSLWTITGSHSNCSFFLLAQALFNREDPGFRILHLNSIYLTVFKNVRDRSQYSTLARQIAPGRVKNMKAALEKALADPFSYMFMDFDPKQHDFLRFRSNIFPEDGPMVVYEI